MHGAEEGHPVHPGRHHPAAAVADGGDPGGLIAHPHDHASVDEPGRVRVLDAHPPNQLGSRARDRALASALVVALRDGAILVAYSQPGMPRHADITVVIPCFNHGRFLLESVERAVGQNGGPPKVIVVDDGSSDAETERALDSLPDGVRLIRQQNAGVAAARNGGFENSDSELLLMVDADDRLPPDALAPLRPPLEANPDVGYCYGLMKLIGAWSGVLRFPDFDPYILLHRSIAGAQLGLVRRRCWEDAGGFDPAIDGYEDWDFCLGALEKGWRGLQINRVTHEYRKHERSGEEEHRRRYRHVYRQLRAKHADLFARRREFAAESDLGPLHRLAYRTFWAWRPIPARLEKAIYRNVLFRRSRPAIR